MLFAVCTLWYVIGVASMMLIWYKYPNKKNLLEFTVLDGVVVLIFGLLGLFIPLFALFTMLDELLASLQDKYSLLGKVLFTLEKKKRPTSKRVKRTK